MNIPAIGTARGVFELFVPGAFVILNAFAVLYSVLDSTAQEQFREVAASPVVGLAVLICLGYLVGAILRLFGTEMPDNWSARWNRLWNRDATEARPTCRERLLAWLKRLLAWLKQLLAWLIRLPAWLNWLLAWLMQLPAGLNRLSDWLEQPGPTKAGSDGITWPTFCDCWNPKTDQQEKKFKRWAVEPFPYVSWTGDTHDFGLPSAEAMRSMSVSEFHKQVWAVKVEGKQGAERWRQKTFFNYCKTLINSADERAAAEIYSAEALVRYLTGMFYALIIALVLMIFGSVIHWVLVPTDWGRVLFPVLGVAYLLILLPIMRHYRIMRIKEVEIVFSATYQHRELFLPPKAQAPSSDASS